MGIKWFFQRVVLSWVIIFLLLSGWYIVIQQKKALIETNIVAYQQAELEIVRGAARSIEMYVSHQVKIHNRVDITELEQEIFDKFIAPIHLSENGITWIYALSEDFPEEYQEKSMPEIVALQEENEASHFAEMAADITEAREGVGSYIWLPEKGKEIVAWAPVQVGDEYIWTVGLSVPLSEILESTGAVKQIQILEIAMSIGTIALLTMLLFWTINTTHQEKASKALKESEMRYRNLFDSAPDGVSILDVEGRILECSQSMAELYGYSQTKELLGKKMTVLMSGNSQAVFQEKISFLKELKETEGEIQVVKPDGSIVDVWRKGIPLTNANGEFSGVLSYDRDISKRVLAEAELKKLYQAVEQSANSIIITDRRGKIEYVNPNFLEISGYAMDEVLGKNPGIVKSGEHNDSYYKNLWETIQSGKKWSGEFCNKTKEGEFYWEQTSIAPVFNERKETTHFIAIKENITQQIYIERALQKSYRELEKKVEERTEELAETNTILRAEIAERKQVEEALKASKLFAENLVETANTVVITLSANANIKTFNRYAEELTGYKKTEVIGKNWFNVFIPQYDKPSAQKVFQELLKNTPDSFLYKNPILLKNGAQRLMSWRNNIILSNLESISGILSIGMDITEQELDKEALRKSEERYRKFFENSPISLWEEDYTEIIQYMNELRDSGVKDMAAYFDEYPEEVNKLVELTHVLDINPATLKIYEAKDKKEFIYNLNNVFTEESLVLFKKQLISYYEGDFQFEGEGVTKTLKGKENNIHLHTSALSEHKVLVSITDITKRKEMEKELHRQATTDPLTKIFNRRYFFDLAQQELERSQRYSRPLSIIIFDIDLFKNVNDTYGHAVGDEVLCHLSVLYGKSLRENDLFARYGGEEFVILLPETDLAQARQMAERMRKDCAETPLDVGLATVNLTISFGVASLDAENLLLDELLLHADKALYRAKNAGRNKVVVWGKDESIT